MQDGNSPLQVLIYEPVVEQDAIPYLPNMRAWRHVAGWLALVCVAGLIVPMPLTAAITGFSFIAHTALIVFMLFVVTATGCLHFMVRAATSEIGLSYAIRHLLLCILLMPVGGLGLFVVTRLVENDLVKHRRMVNQHTKNNLSP